MFFKNKKIITINSARRLTGNPGNFTINVDLPRDNNFSHCVVLEAMVPKTYQLFSDSDVKTLTIEEATGTLTINAVIPSGQYDVNTLATALQLALRTASAATGNTLLYEVTFSEVDQNYTIDSADVGEDFDIQTTNAQAPLMMRVLGFDNPAAGDMASVAGVLLGNDVVDIERTSEIVIRSSIALNYNDNDIAVLYPDNFLAGSQITYAPAFPENYSLDLPNNKATVFKFQLFDDQGLPLVLEDTVRLKMLFWERLE